jgi:hypothetical protein
MSEFESRCGHDFLFFTSFRPVLGPTQPHIRCVPRFISPRVNRLRHEADHSPPSSVKLKNTWIYIFTPSRVEEDSPSNCRRRRKGYLVPGVIGGRPRHWAAQTQRCGSPGWGVGHKDDDLAPYKKKIVAKSKEVKTEFQIR